MYSVQFVEGTVTSLQEEDSCVTGVQYREKDSGKIKVHTQIHTKIVLVKQFCSLQA